MKLSILVAGITLATLAMTATADNITGSASVVSDYVWRGQTQTNGNRAVQGGLDKDFGNGVTASVWGSTIENAEGETEAEVDVIGGYGFAVTDSTNIDLGGIYYAYPSDKDINFYELTAGVTQGLGFADVTASVAMNPVKDEKSMYYNVGASTEVLGFDLSANAGVFDADGAGNRVNDYGVAVGTNIGPANITVGMTRFDNKVTDVDDRYTVSAGVNF